VTLLWWKAR